MTTVNGSANGTKPTAAATPSTKANATKQNKDQDEQKETAGEKAKPELSNTIISAPVPPPTIEQRIAKFKQLETVLERRDQISDAIKQLDDFYIAPSGNSCNLKLTDSRNKTFAISHPSVIGEMIHLARTKFQAELTAIDTEFNFDINIK